MANPDDKLAVCEVHRGNPLPTDLLHYHHIVPQGFGGPDTDENTTWLCAHCHDVLHRLAHYCKSGKVGLAKDRLQQYLPYNPAARDRIWKLIKTAADAMETYEIPEAGSDAAKEETVIVSLRMPRELHGRLKTLASDRTHAKSGRRVGLYRYVLAVLQQHADSLLSMPSTPAAASASKTPSSFGDTTESQADEEILAPAEGPMLFELEERPLPMPGDAETLDVAAEGPRPLIISSDLARWRG